MLKRNHLGSFRILVANNCILMNTFIAKLISTATVQVGYMGDILSRHCKSYVPLTSGVLLLIQNREIQAVHTASELGEFFGYNPEFSC